MQVSTRRLWRGHWPSWTWDLLFHVGFIPRGIKAQKSIYYGRIEITPLKTDSGRARRFRMDNPERSSHGWTWNQSYSYPPRVSLFCQYGRTKPLTKFRSDMWPDCWRWLFLYRSPTWFEETNSDSDSTLSQNIWGEDPNVQMGWTLLWRRNLFSGILLTLDHSIVI